MSFENFVLIRLLLQRPRLVDISQKSARSFTHIYIRIYIYTYVYVGAVGQKKKSEMSARYSIYSMNSVWSCLSKMSFDQAWALKIHICTCIHICMYTNMYVCMYIYIYVGQRPMRCGALERNFSKISSTVNYHDQSSIYIYVYIYIHTHTYTCEI